MNAELDAADFSQANLRGANLQGAELDSCRFFGADLRGANLANVRITKTDFRDALFDENTIFPKDFHSSRNSF